MRGHGRRATALLALVFAAATVQQAAAPGEAVAIADASLRRALETALDKRAGETITQLDLAGLKHLSAARQGIADLSGLEYAVNLETLQLASNDISDVSALAGLTALTKLYLDSNDIAGVSALRHLTSLDSLDLSNNAISDVSPLANLTALNYLYLYDNAIVDVTALRHLTSLDSLALSNNVISDVSALASLASLFELHLSGNTISNVSALGDLTSLQSLELSANRLGDVSALGNLPSLQWLDLANNAIASVAALDSLDSLRELRLDGNRIEDVSALVDSTIGAGAVVGLRDNPLSTLSIERHVPALRAAGAAVSAGRTVPLFPSASAAAGREGVVRVLNRSERDGEVLIEAFDDAGIRAAPVRLAVAAGAAVQFNSADLELGNVAKGMQGSTGPPTVGGWRLELLSTLDIDVYAYIRTADGFLASVHDVLPRDENTGAIRADIFEPSEALAQRNALRVVNAGVADSLWLNRLDGRDPGYCGGLSAGAEGATMVSGAELTELGNWELGFSPSWWVDAMSLLVGPGGKLTNLSTAVAADSRGLLHVPFFPAFSEAGRQGLVRIANLGDAGEARIVATDDGGSSAGPVTLKLGAWQVVYLDSRDLQRGNVAKGLDMGMGSPTRGDWRLRIRSDSDLRVASFVRAANGFLTSMHDVVPLEEDGYHRVVFFNPGRNTRQRSLLRLANEGAFAAAVTVTAVDDAAQPGGEVNMIIPAGHAVTYTAAQLEGGADGLTGRMGAGQGKWRLRVMADEPLTVMSLLATPGGYLTNLSMHGNR